MAKQQRITKGRRAEDPRLSRARELVEVLEAGRQEEADAILSDIARLRESDMFHELGRLTRELHDTLAGFRLDTRLSSLAENDIPDAKERLDYVIKMTDQAAHRTLGAVEQSVPLCERLHAGTLGIATKWRSFLSKELNADEFRGLTREITAFLETAEADTDTVRQHLNDVMIAQDFQDLTGQTLKRVIKLVQDVEDSLVSFMRMSGSKPTKKTQGGAGAKGSRGSQTTGKEDASAMKSQDEVDDLLSSLGF